MNDLFETPIRKRKVRNGIYAYQYRNGTININGTKFFSFKRFCVQGYKSTGT